MYTSSIYIIGGLRYQAVTMFVFVSQQLTLYCLDLLILVPKRVFIFSLVAIINSERLQFLTFYKRDYKMSEYFIYTCTVCLFITQSCRVRQEEVPEIELRSAVF